MISRKRILAASIILIVPLWLSTAGPGPVAAASQPAGARAMVVPATAVSTAISARPALPAASSADSKRPATRSGSEPLALPAVSLPDLGGSSGFDAGSMTSLAVKFGVVLVLLFICLRVLKVVMPGGRQVGGTRANPMLLHTENLGEKQRLCLLDLGGSVLVVGMSAGAMTPLSTVRDREEIDSLRQRYRPSPPRVARPAEMERSGSFSAVLAEAEEPATASEWRDERADLAPATLPRLRDLVRRRSVGVAATSGDPALGQALGRMRELRQRMTRG
jgi:flagellar biogenesis protein FliO